MNITEEALLDLLNDCNKKKRIICIRPGSQISQLKRAPKNKPHGNDGRKFEEVMCPHCTLYGASHIMQRWHFDKCKYKK